MGKIVAVYADGGLVKSNPSPYAGTWAACHVDDEGQRVWESSGFIWPKNDVPTPCVTNNMTEFYAVLMGLEALPDAWSGQVCSDSRVTLLRFCCGGKMTGIPLSWEARMERVLLRLGDLTPVQLDGHPTQNQLSLGRGKRGQIVSIHNVWCDRTCSDLAKGFVAHKEAGSSRA